MARLHLKQVAPGMTLANQVDNLHGQLLLAAGCRLTPRQIGVLQAWGVVEVEVEGEGDFNGGNPSSVVAKRDPRGGEAARLQLQKLFGRQDFSCPVILELFEACASRKVRREVESAIA